MPSPLKSWWAKPWLRRPLMVMLALGLAVVGAWCYVDASGRRAWRNVSAQLAAQGETLNLPELLWPDVPEAANFCASAPLHDLAAGGQGTEELKNRGRRSRKQLKATLDLNPEAWAAGAFHGVQQGRPIDLAKLAKALRQGNPPWMPALPGEPARDVAAGLAKWDPLFAQLADGLARPQAQWMPPLRSQLLTKPLSKARVPHLQLASELGQALALRAAVAGAAGDFRTALICLQLADRLAEASFYEPLVVNFLSACATEEMMANAVWELAFNHAGTPAEWAALERLFARMDLRAKQLRADRGQLALYLNGIQYDRDLLHRTKEKNTLSDMALPASDIVPRGFYDATAADLASRSLQHVIRPLRDDGWPAATRGYRELASPRGQKKLPAWSIPQRISDALLEQLVQSLGRAIHTQAVLHQAAIACVLERVRAATGSYPGSLAGLTLLDGRPLPADPATGSAMQYRPTDDGRYVLWSLGVDGIDDHGKRGSLYQEPSNSYYHGDWVWSYAP